MALGLCVAVLAAGAVGQFIHQGSPYAASNWISLAAAMLAAAGIVQLDKRPQWLRLQRASRWSALLLMVWVANRLPFDVLTMTGTMGRRTASGAIVIASVDWPGTTTRALALAAAVVLAHLALSRPAPSRPAAWYGYAAFVLALPYPVFRMVWALGGTPGLSQPGAGGHGYAPLLLAVPWVLAAILSLLLVPTWRWMPRRLLLVAGWTATAIVGTIGPAAVWALVSALAAPAAPPPGAAKAPGIALWVFVLFYGSWFLWAIAAAAATRSYQLRSARGADVVGTS